MRRDFNTQIMPCPASKRGRGVCEGDLKWGHSEVVLLHQLLLLFFFRFFSCFSSELLLIFYLFNLRVRWGFFFPPASWDAFFLFLLLFLLLLLLLSFAKYAVFMRTANGKDGQKINCSNFLVGTWQQ